MRAELSNEMWAGTGRIVRLSMYGTTEREVLEVDPTARPSFLARLADAGDASREERTSTPSSRCPRRSRSLRTCALGRNDSQRRHTVSDAVP